MTAPSVLPGSFPADERASDRLGDLRLAQPGGAGAGRSGRSGAACGRPRALIRQIKPAAVVGFGGYPTLPPLYAATRRKVPTLIHEQNAVMGRANKALAGARRRDRRRLPARQDARLGAKTVVDRQSGAAGRAGGGQDALPAVRRRASRSSCWCSAAARARSSFPRRCRRRSRCCPRRSASGLRVTQQARAEDDVARVKAAYRQARRRGRGLALLHRHGGSASAAAHLVISRSGASTVSEIAVIGRPALLVPYPLCARP